MLRISYKVLFISIICLSIFAWRLDSFGRVLLVFIILFGSEIFLALRFGVMYTGYGPLNKNESPVFFWANFVFTSLLFAIVASVFVTDLSRPIEKKTRLPVKVYWLDYEGEKKLYAKLKAEDSYIQQTYVTHPWLITDADDNAWDVYLPDAQPRIVQIVAPKKK